ncbi:MAG: aminopeptidase N, partial [Pseudomonadota bacterium]
AMVGGKLNSIFDTFTTMSGRKVALEIYVEPGKENRCHWAMESLKLCMRWDEQAFGREYDLDIFMIVAVSAFVFGAMENKGLNIFNDRLLLADPDTATDVDYDRIEAVIAHEYFHNWTGDRITCRDWFQLCLKEGFTVYRDQEFTSDVRSRPVKRIADVRHLRNTQFVEDASPLAHAVRPDQYREINNFYTTTIYEKGAELIRMLKILVGDKKFRESTDLYFNRHDGQAVTIEDFIACFADASGKDFGQFMEWYHQAGTPEVVVQPSYDEKSGIYELKFSQKIPPTPNQTVKKPHVIPVALGFLDQHGNDIPLQDEDGKALAVPVVILDQAEQAFKFKTPVRPVPSLLRGFSAPVNLKTPLSDEELAVLVKSDTDSFNRWEAAQELALRYLRPMSRSGSIEKTSAQIVVDAIGVLMNDDKAEPAFRALAVVPPSELDICRELGKNVDPKKVHTARRSLVAAMCDKLGADALALYKKFDTKAAYIPDAEQTGRRSFRNTLLKLLTHNSQPEHLQLALQQLESATNLTDRVGALAALAQNPSAEREKALKIFEGRYKDEPLVLDKWFTIQALYDQPEALQVIESLTNHPVFSFKTPNRVYALLNSFAQNNLSQFHRDDGAGYRFIADCVIKLDPILPSVSARLMTSFRSMSWLDEKLKKSARMEVERVANTNGLSPDVADLSTRLLGS